MTGRGSPSNAVPPAAPGPTLDLREWWALACAYRRAALVIVGAAVLAAFATLAVLPPSYTAETRLLMRMGREKFSALDPGPNERNVLFQEREQNVNNEIEILNDPNLMREAFDRLKAALPQAVAASPSGLLERALALLRWLARTLADAFNAAIEWLKAPLYWLGLSDRLTADQKLLRDFSRALLARGIKNTDVIVVGFTWRDPAFAAAAANILVDVYRSRHVRIFDLASPAGFYRERLDAARAALGTVDAAIATLLRSSDRASFDIEQQSDLGTLAEFERQREAARLARQQAAAWVDRLTKTGTSPDGPDWIDTPPDAAASVTLQGIDQRYAALVGRQTELATRFRPAAPDMQAIAQSLRRFRAEKAAALLAFYQGQVQAMDNRIAGIGGKIDEQRRQAVGLSEASLRYQRLLGERKAAQARVDEAAARLAAMEADKDLNRQDVASFTVVSPAEPPATQSGPSKPLVLGIAAFLGLVLALAYAAVMETTRQTVRSAADLQRGLGLPVFTRPTHAA